MTGFHSLCYVPDEQLWVSAARAPEQHNLSEEGISYRTFPFAGQINGVYLEAPNHFHPNKDLGKAHVNSALFSCLHLIQD